MRDSWLRKFDRAEEHLEEINHLIGPSARTRQAHPVSERLETYHGTRQWVYRLDMGVELDEERLAILAGDFLFNVRSGLDHRAISLVPAEQKHRASFPIFSDDPLAIDPATGGHVNTKAWKAWKGTIQPFPDSAAAALLVLQPFDSARKLGKRAEDHSLDVLRVLHDADEHQELFVADRMLLQVDVLVGGQIVRSAPSAVQDGTVVYASSDKENVEVVGMPEVGLGAGKKGRDKWRWPVPLAFDAMLNHIAAEVLPALAGLLVYPP
jgi:hypothetical protein